MTTQDVKTSSQATFTRGVVRWAVQMTMALVVFGVILFAAAGRLNWINGWVFLGLNALTQVISSLVLIPRRPDMLAERSQSHEGTKSWDRFYAPAITLFGPLALILVAGLDARFGWTPPIPVAWLIVGLLLAFAFQMFVVWAMATNPFFSTTVRIQDDRGQQVVASGPYGILRHPGYAGSVGYNLVIPLVLGSLWTYIPALLTILLIFLRTRLEDRALQEELPGYREYAQKVRSRLIPGIW
jgi:protein-S-isoprenylcysteine O-methyltransferase Ste14